MLHPPQHDRARQVLLLTDGRVPHGYEALDLCRAMASSTRIFSVGVGASPNRSFMQNLVQPSHGSCIFIPVGPHIDAYVQEHLYKLLRRYIPTIGVHWNLGVSTQSIPQRLPPAHINDRLIVYALADDRPIPLHHASSVEIRTEKNSCRLDIIDSDRVANNSSRTIARLAARALIRQLESQQTSIEQDEIRQRIIDLSCRYNILCSYTEFTGLVNAPAPECESDYSPSLSPSHSESPQPSRGRMQLECTISISLVPRTRSTSVSSNESNRGEPTVRRLLHLQASDGLWKFDACKNLVEELTGKPFDAFPSSETDANELITAMVLVVLEAQFSAWKPSWELAAENARQRLICLFDNDWEKLAALFQTIRTIING